MSTGSLPKFPAISAHAASKAAPLVVKASAAERYPIDELLRLCRSVDHGIVGALIMAPYAVSLAIVP